jgi:hypothetical protein
MKIINLCPRCGKDFMYDRMDVHLHRVTAWDADTKEPCSFETICQNCDEIENLNNLVMKTIMVQFVKSFPDSSVTTMKPAKLYSFNIENDIDIHVGDVLRTSRYDSLLRVWEVLTPGFKQYNPKTSELSNTESLENNFYPIRELVFDPEQVHLTFFDVVDE